mmetsp:Transcript_12503/g.21036  ORF Transcript_12503/g.21036 Transcript_12503/m.21036 type:complete len:243 (+) Transcript_12503:1089-1817(+)
MHDLGQMNFKFADKSRGISNCVALASRLQIFEDDNVSELIRSKYISDEFREEQIKEVADQLCLTERVSIFLRSKSFEGKTTEEAEWYSTKFSSETIPDELLQKMKNPASPVGSKKLDLPPANNLIPKNFDVLAKQEDHSAKPKLIKKWEDCDLWYKKDDKFERPKAIVEMKIYTNDCGFGKNLEGRLFANVWREVQSEYLREFNYMADCANLSFDVVNMTDNLNFTWSGFNDSLQNYLKESV